MQKHIETLDAMKLQNKMTRSNNGENKIPEKQHEHSMGKGPIVIHKEQMQENKKSWTAQRPMLQQKQRQSESVVFTTKWETFE